MGKQILIHASRRPKLYLKFQITQGLVATIWSSPTRNRICLSYL